MWEKDVAELPNTRLERFRTVDPCLNADGIKGIYGTSLFGVLKSSAVDLPISPVSDVVGSQRWKNTVIFHLLLNSPSDAPAHVVILYLLLMAAKNLAGLCPPDQDFMGVNPSLQTSRRQLFQHAALGFDREESGDHRTNEQDDRERGEHVLNAH